MADNRVISKIEFSSYNDESLSSNSESKKLALLDENEEKESIGYGRIIVHPLFKPKVWLEWVTPDIQVEIVKMARVSGDTENKDLKLLRSLFKRRDFSTFQMANMCIGVETGRDVGRQIMRHWSIENKILDVQELSQRYKKVTPQQFGNELEDSVEVRYPFYPKEVRYPCSKDRQASWRPQPEEEDELLGWVAERFQNSVEGKLYGTIKIPDSIKCSTYRKENEWFLRDQSRKWKRTMEKYLYALEVKGYSKESARTYLEEAMTPTTFYLNGTVRSWVHFIQARALGDVGIPQPDHQVLAKMILEILIKHEIPIIYEMITKTEETDK